MNSKRIMTANAFYLGITGLLLTFIPTEVASQAKITDTKGLYVLTLQLLGGLHLGFSMLSWMTKDKVIGGIFNKPLVIGNLVYYTTSFFALLKLVTKVNPDNFATVLGLTLIYAVFSLSFGYLFMANPSTLK